MQVVSTGNLCRGLAQLRQCLIHAVIDAHKVDEVEVHGLPALIDSPTDVDRASLLVAVRHVVGIAVTEEHQHPLLIILPILKKPGVLWQTGSAEGEVVLKPAGIILLRMAERIHARHNAAATPVVCPRNVVHGVFLIGYAVTVVHLTHAVNIGRAADFIPGVVGQVVMVDILRHHHDAWLARAAKDIGEHRGLHRVAANAEVALTRNISDAVVEVERHIAAEATQRNHAVVVVGIIAGNGLGALGNHRGGIVAFLPYWQVVNKLSRSGHILIYSQQILAVNSVVGHLLRIERHSTTDCYKAYQCPDSRFLHVFLI